MDLWFLCLVPPAAQFSKLSNFSYQTTTNNTALTASHQHRLRLNTLFSWKSLKLLLNYCPSGDCFKLFLLHASCFYRAFYFFCLFMHIFSPCLFIFWRAAVIVVVCFFAKNKKTKKKKLLVPLNPFPDILDGYWPIIFMSCW